MTIRGIIEGVHRGNLEQMAQLHAIPKRTVTDPLEKHECNDSLIFYVFDKVTRVLQGHTLAQWFVILCLDKLHRISIDLKKEKKMASH